MKKDDNDQKVIPISSKRKEPEWVIKGKTIKGLIEELKTFEDQNLEVKISFDDGETMKCISMVGKDFDGEKQVCVLLNCELDY